MEKSFKFTTIKNWLNEQQSTEPFYGCVMMDPKKIEGWEEIHLAGIDEKDTYTKPNDDSYGLEYEPHITLVYGIIEDEVDPSVIVDMMEQKLDPISVKISEIDVFENEEYDVVKYNVPVTKELLKYRNMFLESFSNTQKFNDYKPHITIAYCKPRTGNKYKKILNEPFKINFVKGVYSYHKQDGSEDLIRRVVNLETKEEEKLNNDIIKSKKVKIK